MPLWNSELPTNRKVLPVLAGTPFAVTIFASEVMDDRLRDRRLEYYRHDTVFGFKKVRTRIVFAKVCVFNDNRHAKAGSWKAR